MLEDIFKAMDKHKEEIRNFARMQKDTNYIRLVNLALDLGISNFNYFIYDPVALSDLIDEKEKEQSLERKMLFDNYRESIRVI